MDERDAIALHEAYVGGDLDTVYTPLHWAAGEDDTQLIEWLLAHGADPEARTNVDDYSTPLEEAVILGHEEAAMALRAWAARNVDS